MKIKKIRARNFSEALSMVRKELGEDAVILSSEDKKGVRSFVEVTAAIDHDIGVTDIQPPVSPIVNKVPGEAAIQFNSELTELRNEIKVLRQSVESMKDKGFELKLPEDRKNIFNFLKERSIRDEFALGIAENVNGIEDLSSTISKEVRTSWYVDKPISDTEKIAAWNGKKIIMLIGPTGVGKTTTIAKLASNAIREGRRVAIISYDTFKIGAAEQIRIYSRMIGIPLDIISNRSELRNSIRKHSDRDLFLMDTSGQNPKDGDYITWLKGVCSEGLPIETQLLLSTSSDSDFLMDTYKHYKSVPIDYLAFTKTDEAVRLGSIYNVCRVYKKPVAYITNGQNVPGNIDFVDSSQLTNLILRTGSA